MWGRDTRRERWRYIFCPFPLVAGISVFITRSTSSNNLGLHSASSGHHPCYQKARDQGCADALDVCQELKVCFRKWHFTGEYPREAGICWSMSWAKRGIRMALVGWIRDSERLSNTCKNVPKILQDDTEEFQDQMEGITGLGCPGALLPWCPRGIKDASLGVLLPMPFFWEWRQKGASNAGGSCRCRSWRSFSIPC